MNEALAKNLQTGNGQISEQIGYVVFNTETGRYMPEVNLSAGDNSATFQKLRAAA
jgi:hypothetical protein